MNSCKVKSKSKRNFSGSNSVTQLLHRCANQARMGICKLMAIWPRHITKWSVKWLKKFRAPLDPVRPKSLLRDDPFMSASVGPSHPLSPPVTLHDLGPVASQLPSSLSLLPTCRKEMPSAVLCVSMSIKNREQKREVVVINEVTVNAADGNGNGCAKVTQKRPLNRRKSESANAKPRTRRMKGLSRK